MVVRIHRFRTMGVATALYHFSHSTVASPLGRSSSFRPPRFSIPYAGNGAALPTPDVVHERNL